jgi:hypothetical protein
MDNFPRTHVSHTAELSPLGTEMHRTGIFLELTARRMEDRLAIIPRFPAASTRSELMRFDWTRAVRGVSSQHNEQTRNDFVSLVRSCLTGKSHKLTGHRPLPGGEPIPSLNGSLVGQDEFLLPPRAYNVTSTLARHRTSAVRPRDHDRRRQSVYGCLEQLVRGTSGAHVRLTRNMRNLPAASVSDLQNSIRTRESQEVPQPSERLWNVSRPRTRQRGLSGRNRLAT